MNKKELIIESARKLFTKYGFKKVSMDEIAKDASVSKVTIYSYFKDKNDLLDYFIHEEIERMKKIINKKCEEGYFVDHFNICLFELFKYKNEQQLLLSLANEANLFNNDSLKSTLNKIDENIIIFLEEKLNYAQENNIINKCDSKLIASILFASYTSVLFKYEYYKAYLTDEEIRENLLLILKKGLFLKGGNNESN